jgi:SMI1-KNR4 cell-wall
MPIMDDIFDDGMSYSGPPLTDDMVLAAEAALGVRLPGEYVGLLRQRNGGSLRKRCYPTPFPTSWAPDHIGVRAIFGIGGERGTDKMTSYLVSEWGYPDVGLVLCSMPSGGHDAVMLDYSAVEEGGEPSVVYVDEDRVPRRIAGSFDEFVRGLVPCSDFGANQS